MPRFPERASALERRIDPEAVDAHASVRVRPDSSAQLATSEQQPAPLPVHAPAELDLGGLIDVSEPVYAPAAHGDAGLAGLDLLGELSGTAPAPVPDPLAALDDFSSAFGSATAAVVQVQPTQDVQQLLRKLYTSDGGAFL
jgi:hypothetical protein